MPSKDYKWFLKADTSKYKNKYIAIIDEKIVAFGENAKVVWKKAKEKYPNKEPLMAKIPEDEILILDVKK